MRRTAKSIFISFVLIFSLALAAGAGGFHFKSGSFTSGSLTFNGVGVGFGNSDYVAVMDADATVRALCENKGGNIAPGQQELFASVPGAPDSIENTEENGQAAVSLTVEDPGVANLVSPITKKDCPNGNWTAVDLIVVEWTSAHITITEMGTGEVLFDQAYVCSGGGDVLDSNGLPTGAVNPVSCVEA